MRTVLFVAAVLAVFAVATGRSVEETEDFEAFMNKVQAHHEKVAPRQKRQVTGITATCPYCDTNVWMAYPDWNDCTKFNYCYGGTITKYSCNTIVGDTSRVWYFNPTTKVCELSPDPTNSCFTRSFDLSTLTV